MNVYNNLTYVYDATQNRDIEVLAPTYSDACDYEKFLTKIHKKIIRYRVDHDIVIDFKGKKQYYETIPKRQVQ